MRPEYVLRDPSAVFTPALLFYRELIGRNIATMLRVAGGPERLRPHVKTHKTREIVRLLLEAGIRRHKCATIAEAELLAGCDVPDVLIAYPLVGPNCSRLARLATKYPQTRFAVLVDSQTGLDQLLAAVEPGRVDAFLDVDVGQHRTGVAPGTAAVALYEKLARSGGVAPAGLHVYDGHNHQQAATERQAAVEALLVPVLALRDELKRRGLPVPRVVFGGTPTFPIYALQQIPQAECSPGTCVLHDYNYGQKFQDMDFVPAALLLTRVISRPTPTRVTFDLGYKAVASDPPAGKRCLLLDVPDYETVLQNEEHLVIETPAADRFRPGDVAYAVPAHVCPTCALHQFAYVVEQGAVVGRWDIVGRDRILTV